jgi:hypothetical protein
MAAMDASPPEVTVAQRIRDAMGAFDVPARRLVGVLLSRPATIAELVAASGVPRRVVEQLLRDMGADVERGAGAGEDAYRVAPVAAPAYTAAFDPDGLAGRRLGDPLAARLAGRPDLEAFVAGLAVSRPGPDRDLDHVAATAQTVARRALWLDAGYDLTRTPLLCVGDHDLTSLGVAACTPGARVVVVDIDDRVLEFVDGVARARGWDVRCLWWDLRCGLPSSATGVADVAFTDPPYTPEGVTTFLVAAVQGLRDPDRGRVVMAYGYGDHQPALGVKVQRAVSDLQIAVEAILPGFNEYQGAQAIGSRSDLYVCRPTATTWRALPTLTKRQAGRIYTHGERSLESSSAASSIVLGEVLDRVTRSQAEDGGDGRPPLLLVGDGWPRAPGLGSAQRASPATVLAKGVPAQLLGARDLHAVVDLSTSPAAWVLRCLLAVTARRLTAVIVAGGWTAADAALVVTKYSTRVEPLPGGRWELLVADRVHDDSASVVAEVLSRAHARLGNAWRDALVATARAGGTSMTKNEARACVQQGSTTGLPAVPLLELPRHLLPRVLDEVRASRPAADSDGG